MAVEEPNRFAFLAIREGVDADAGVAPPPCALGEIQRDWRRDRLVADVSAPLWILTHKDLRTTARVRVLRDHLPAAIVRKRAIVSGSEKASLE
jgi:hypothetical protein